MSNPNLADAYTTIADDYDRIVEVDAWMRQILWERYLCLFQPSQCVLDVGCGTGIDAVFLAEHGMHVTGIDISPGMVAQLQAKVERRGLTDRVSAHVLALNELCKLPPEHFDGILSAFAGLNTASDLKAFAMDAARLLQPGGHLLVHMVNRFSLWEWLTLVRRGRLAAALRLPRQAERTFTIGGQPIRHHLFFPKQTYRRFFATYFDLDAYYGLGCLRPPDNIAWIPEPLVKALAALEQRVRSRGPFVNGGRFFTLVMTRRKAL